MRHENLIKNFERLLRGGSGGGGGSEVSADFQEPFLPALLAWQQRFLASVDFSIWRPYLFSTDIVKTLPWCQVSCQALWVYSAAQKRDRRQGGKVTGPQPLSDSAIGQASSPSYQTSKAPGPSRGHRDSFGVSVLM